MESLFLYQVLFLTFQRSFSTLRNILGSFLIFSIATFYCNMYFLGVYFLELFQQFAQFSCLIEFGSWSL